MKHFEPISHASSGHSSAKGCRWSVALYIWTLAALAVPNAILSAVDGLAPLPAAANLLLPVGVYGLLLALSRRVGKMVWWLFPAIFLAAFELVLLNLYGRSVIAVDMFLNLVTTNAGEVSELLGNLLPALLQVAVLYLVPLIAAIVALRRGWLMRRNALVGFRRLALGVAVAGAVCFVGSFFAAGPQGYRPSRDLFPVNAVSNAITACERTREANAYEATSAGCRFGARSERPDSVAEIYLMVVGETSRGENWQLAGYERPTNPRLAADSGVVYFSHALSQSNTTHKSVPMLLSALTAATYRDSIARTRSIMQAFAEAGFTTWFLSSQQHNHSYIDHFSRQADHCIYLADSVGSAAADASLLPLLRQALAAPGLKKFIVLHTYGSHFSYADRYTDADRRFTPDYPVDAEVRYRQNLINAYDNSIVATDRLLAELTGELRQTGTSSAMLYTSDHGEDIFDDSRGLFLHASPVPSAHQINVPLLAWLSPEFTAAHPDLAAALRRNAALTVSSSQSFFPTMLQLGGVTTATADQRQWSLASDTFTEQKPIYLNDLNEAVDLPGAKLDPEDFDFLRLRGYHL